MPLPAEMILSILEAAYYTPTLEPDTDLLLACSVVCKAWAAPAQTLLFQSIILRSQRAYIAFSEAVDRSTERGRALSQCVHSLRAIIDPSQPFRLLPRSFARAATLCPNLQEIDLSLYGARVIESEASEYPLSLERSKAPTSSFDATTLSLLRAGPAGLAAGGGLPRGAPVRLDGSRLGDEFGDVVELRALAAVAVMVPGLLGQAGRDGECDESGQHVRISCSVT